VALSASTSQAVCQFACMSALSQARSVAELLMG